MRITKPRFFDSFRCIAAACPDSCCKEWDVQVDEEAAGFYRSLSGPLGDRLREVLHTRDGETVMTIIDGRCPMWQQDGLCRIQRELGEAALCKTCREFPRLTHDYGDFVELGLELSCPEAARMILNATPEEQSLISEEDSASGESEYDEEDMEILLASREKMLALLSDESRPVGETLALGLLYGCQVQTELDGAEASSFDPESSLEEMRSLAKAGDEDAMLDFFLDLEILTPEWETLLHNPAPSGFDRRYMSLARYFVQRYWLQAVSDYDLYSRVKFMVIACLLMRHLGGDLNRTAQLFSKEIENDADNVEAIWDAAYTHPAFPDDKIFGLLLFGT